MVHGDVLAAFIPVIEVVDSLPLPVERGIEDAGSIEAVDDEVGFVRVRPLADVTGEYGTVDSVDR